MRKLWDRMRCFLSGPEQSAGHHNHNGEGGGGGGQHRSYSQPDPVQRGAEMSGLDDVSSSIVMPITQIGQRNVGLSDRSDLVQTWETSNNGSTESYGVTWLPNTITHSEEPNLGYGSMDYNNDLELFAERGFCDVNAVDEGGRSALHVAATQNNAALVAGLLQASADPNKSDISGDTPLIIAASHGNLAIVQLLTSAGCDLDLRTIEGRTALMEAVMARCLDVARHLVDNRCHINVLDSHGYSALSDAVQCGMKECVDVLLHGGADVNVQDSRGRSPLHIAVLLGHTDIAQQLMSFGSFLNVQDADGFSPLYMAAWDPWQKNTWTILSSLCNQGADLNSPDHQGTAPLAKTQARSHIATLLQHGCIVNCTLNMGLTLPEFYALQQKWDIVVAFLAAGFDRNLVIAMPVRETSGAKYLAYMALRNICSQPASLRDLCRLATRACLKRPIPKSVELLPLPRIIREFVAMKNILPPSSC